MTQGSLPAVYYPALAPREFWLSFSFISFQHCATLVSVSIIYLLIPSDLASSRRYHSKLVCKLLAILSNLGVCPWDSIYAAASWLFPIFPDIHWTLPNFCRVVIDKLSSTWGLILISMAVFFRSFVLCFSLSTTILARWVYVTQLSIHNSNTWMWVEGGPDPQLSSKELEGNHNVLPLFHPFIIKCKLG